MMTYLTALVVRVRMMICLIVVGMLVVLVVFWHLHTISVVILSPIHHHVLSLMPVVVVHVESVVCGGGVDRRP